MVANDIDMDTAEVWHVSRNGTRYGPYTAAVLKTWIEGGQLAPDVTISNGGAELTLTEFLAQLNGENPAGSGSQDGQLELLDEEPVSRGNRAKPLPMAERIEAASDALPDVAPPLPPSPSIPATGTDQARFSMIMATPDEAAAPSRDRIVMLGRRQSGKTVYLATLYSVLWKSLDSATAKALSGSGHRELMSIVQTLKEGRWPHATQASLQIDLEVEYKARKRLMVTLDFAGELFSKAFLHDQGSAPEVRPLLNHIDHAAAVMLLVDPGVAVGQDAQAIMEDDFGLVQAVQRIRNWPGGEQVPIVFVLTKADAHQEILDRFGGPVGFVRAHFPALVRLMKQVPIFQISAVQCTQNGAGSIVPRIDSVCINVEKPLLYCLNIIDRMQREDEVRQERERQQEALLASERKQMATERMQSRILTTFIVIIFLIGAAAVGAIVVYKF
jgi:Double-GTPase 2